MDAAAARALLADAVLRSSRGDDAGAAALVEAAGRVAPGLADLAAARAALAFNVAARAWNAGDAARAETGLRASLAQVRLPQAAAALAELQQRRAAVLAQAGDWAAAGAALHEALHLGAPRAPVATLAARVGAACLAAALGSAPRDVLSAADLALAAWDLAPGRDSYDAAWKLCVSVGPALLGPAVPEDRLRARATGGIGSYAARIALGNVLRRAGLRNAAEIAYQGAHALWPTAPFAASRLAGLHAEQRRWRIADELHGAIGRVHGGREAIIRLDAAFLETLRARPAPDEVAIDSAAPPGAPPPAWVVFAGADGGYFARFGRQMAASVRACCGTAGALHLHVVNPGPGQEAELAALRAELAPLRLDWSIERIDLSAFGANRPTYYACTRFLRLPQLLRRHACPVMLLDIDSRVLRDLAPLLAQVTGEDADLGMIDGEPAEIWGSCWADQLAIMPTPRGHDFAALVAAYIGHFFAAGRRDWFLDQIALYAAWHVGFTGRPAPRRIVWPRDIQNAGPESFVWSMHMSQPGNRHATPG